MCGCTSQTCGVEEALLFVVDSDMSKKEGYTSPRLYTVCVELGGRYFAAGEVPHARQNAFKNLF